MGHDDPREEHQPSSGCPEWCEQPAGHRWDDEWLHGPVRVHTWRRPVADHQHIEVREIEQLSAGGRIVRQREIVLDVEAPTQWDLTTAEKVLAVLSKAIDHARGRAGDGSDGTVL